MKVTYLPYHDYRAGQVVKCRDLEIGEVAEDCGAKFYMAEDGLYYNGKIIHTMREVLMYRSGQYIGCNRQVTII